MLWDREIHKLAIFFLFFYWFVTYRKKTQDFKWLSGFIQINPSNHLHTLLNYEVMKIMQVEDEKVGIFMYVFL